MTTIVRNNHYVRSHFKKKETLKVQKKKEWELAGKKFGDIMNVKKREYIEVSEFHSIHFVKRSL